MVFLLISNDWHKILITSFVVMTSAGNASTQEKVKMEKECCTCKASTAIMWCKHLLLFEVFIGHDW